MAVIFWNQSEMKRILIADHLKLLGSLTENKMNYTG